MARSHPETWLLTLLRIMLEGQIQGKETKNNVLGLATETKEGSISYEELKMSTQVKMEVDKDVNLPYGRTLQRYIRWTMSYIPYKIFHTCSKGVILKLTFLLAINRLAAPLCSRNSVTASGGGWGVRGGAVAPGGHSKGAALWVDPSIFSLLELLSLLY